GGAKGGKLRNIRPKLPATVTSGGPSRCCVPSPNKSGTSIKTVRAMSAGATRGGRINIFLNRVSGFIVFPSFIEAWIVVRGDFFLFVFVVCWCHRADWQ